jgi:hypothetical protein
VEAWDTLESWTKETALTFSDLAGRALDVPLIGNWGYVGFSYLYSYTMHIYTQQLYVGRWIDDVNTRLAGILSWSTIQANILGTWAWLNTIDDKIWTRAQAAALWRWWWLDDPINLMWEGFRTKILGAWSWLNTIDDRIWSTAGSRIRETWSWIDGIDDRIWSTALARWAWLNTIDDRIRDIAWSHIAPKLGDWFWSFIVLEVTMVSKIGYRILSTLWNMEWDDARKEVK